MTAVVARSDSAMAPHRNQFWFFRVNTDPFWERMLKEWKISAMDMVRKAMVVPSGLFTISQTPLSIKCPMKYAAITMTVTKIP